MPVIRGTAEADTLIGTESNDVIYGGDGVDRLEGGAGDDRLYGGAGVGPYGQMGDNTLIGGAGDDRYYIQGSGNTTTEEADGGLDRVYWMPVAGEQSNWYVTQAYVEHIYIVRNDAITAPDSGEYFVFDEGYDSSDGGNHTIFGSDQNDSFTWNAGRDVFYGGDGDDFVSAENAYGIDVATDNLRYFGGAGDDHVHVNWWGSDIFGWSDADQPYDYISFDGGSGMDNMDFQLSQLSTMFVDTIQIRLRDVEVVNFDLVSFGSSRWDLDGKSPFDFTIKFISTVTEPPAEGPFDMSYDVTDLSLNLQLGATHDYVNIESLAYYPAWGAGQFVVNSGAGNDWVDFDALDWQGQGITTPDVTLAIQLGAGNDMATSHGDRVTISGGAGSDTIEVTGSDNTLSGGLGDDEIRVVDGLNNSLSAGMAMICCSPARAKTGSMAAQAMIVSTQATAMT